jgi:hypothetical protein
VAKKLEAALLGKLLRIDIEPARGDAYSLEWKQSNAPALGWDAVNNRLVFALGAIGGEAPVQVAAATKKAFADWHDFEPDEWGLKLRVADRGRMVTMGRVLRIDYASTKWGELAEYTHDCDGHSFARRRGNDQESFWIVEGTLRATARGLVG